MEALIDNDVLYKLSRYDLLAEFERLLEIRRFDRPHGRISTAPYALKVMQKPVPSDRWPDSRQADVLRQFCFNRSRGVTGSQSDTLVRLNVDAFDPGEVTLVAYALEHQSSLIFTGDKRAIRAIAYHPQLREIAAILNRRFVHLEMVMRILSDRLGWRRISSLVVASGVDTTLQRVYRQTSERDMAETLDASVLGLRERTGDLLINSF